MKKLKEIEDLAKITLDKPNETFDVNRFVALIRDGDITTPREIHQLIQYARKELSKYEREMKEYLENKCKNHEFSDWVYSWRRNLFGDFHCHFERNCKHCGYKEMHKSDSVEDCPEGAENAKKVYYNNHI